MKKAMVRRLLVVSSGGVVEDPSEGFIYRKIIKLAVMETYNDMKKMEEIINISPLDWTIVPPLMLKNGPQKDNYRVSEEIMPHGGWQIRRSDLAQFMISLLEKPESIRKKLTIAY